MPPEPLTKGRHARVAKRPLRHGKMNAPIERDGDVGQAWERAIGQFISDQGQVRQDHRIASRPFSRQQYQLARLLLRQKIRLSSGNVT